MGRRAPVRRGSLPPRSTTIPFRTREGERLRDAARFVQEHRVLDVERLERGGEYEVTALVHPWAREGGEPPLPVRRAWLAGLLEIHDAWRRDLIRRDSPFHLSVRLWEPHFCNSGVLAALGEAAADADTVLPPSAGVRQTPPAEYHEGLDLARYLWRGSEVLRTDRLSAWDPDEQADVRRGAAHILPVTDGDFVVRRRLARVWVATGR